MDSTKSWLIALTVSLVGFIIYVLMRLSQMQDEIYFATGLAVMPEDTLKEKGLLYEGFTNVKNIDIKHIKNILQKK